MVPVPSPVCVCGGFLPASHSSRASRLSPAFGRGSCCHCWSPRRHGDQACSFFFFLAKPPSHHSACQCVLTYREAAAWAQQRKQAAEQHGFRMGMARVSRFEIKQSSQFGQTWNQSPVAMSGEGLRDKQLLSIFKLRLCSKSSRALVERNLVPSAASVRITTKVTRYLLGQSQECVELPLTKFTFLHSRLI